MARSSWQLPLPALGKAQLGRDYPQILGGPLDGSPTESGSIRLGLDHENIDRPVGQHGAQEISFHLARGSGLWAGLLLFVAALAAQLVIRGAVDRVALPDEPRSLDAVCDRRRRDRKGEAIVVLAEIVFAGSINRRVGKELSRITK
jgi:hypothetical protein